jgi:hypothetical protein
VTMLTAKTYLSPNWAASCRLVSSLLTRLSRHSSSKHYVQCKLTMGARNVGLSVIVGCAMVWLGVAVGRAMP